MKISKILLENFRAFRSSEIDVRNLNVFLGKNDQGKSSILEAMDIFFNDGKGTVKVTEDDLNKMLSGGVSEFAIGIQFENFPDPIIIDETNETSLKKECLLNKQEKLEIWKLFKKGRLSSVQIKCFHPCNDDFLRFMLTKNVNELRAFVDENNIHVEDRRKAAEMRRAIRTHYKERDGSLDLQEVKIPINDGDLKKIWDKIKIYMPVFTLVSADRENLDTDSDFQNPLKNRIKEIFQGEEEILEKLNSVSEKVYSEIMIFAERTIEEFNILMGDKINIKPSIPATSDLKWYNVYKKIGFETEDSIPMNQRGSGFRRLILLASIFARTKEDLNDNVDVVYAIEEPESSLHPSWQKKLADALIELSEKEKYQTFLTSHSPAMIRIFNTSSIKYVEKENGESRVYDFNEDIATKIIETMGLLPNIGKVVVCVEGNNDINFLLNINQNIEELKEIIDLKKERESGILTIMPMHGGNLKDFIAKHYLKNTNVLEFHLYDKDDGSYFEDIEKVRQRKDGSYGTLTSLREIENYSPPEVLEEYFNVKLASEMSSIEDWGEKNIPKLIEEKVKMKESIVKKKICNDCSKKITKDHLMEMGTWNEVKGWFEKIKEMVERCYE